MGVEVAFREGTTGVRDPEDRDTDPVPGLTAQERECFTEGVGNGRPGLPG